MDKTDPMKYTTPGIPIQLTHRLSLLTTLGYNQQTRSYENKEVQFEMALDVDGNKSRMSKKINLKDVIGGVKHGKYKLDSPEVVLTYKMEVKVEGGQEEKEKIVERPSKDPKKIKFEEDYMSGQGREEYKQNVREEKVERKDKSRFRTVVHSPVEEDLGVS